MKGAWKCVIVGNGELCVQMDGMTQMPELCVGSLVSVAEKTLILNYSQKFTVWVRFGLKALVAMVLKNFSLSVVTVHGARHQNVVRVRV